MKEAGLLEQSADHYKYSEDKEKKI